VARSSRGDGRGSDTGPLQQNRIARIAFNYGIHRGSLVQRQIKGSRPVQKSALRGFHLQRAVYLHPVFRCGLVFSAGIENSITDHTKRLTNIATL
jgi:hypothetical protein